ncbi:MAG: hypothetical protein M1429_02605 [Patescibacteria group bacterium]|nr:hypothetical protein [Patescibacteria group bacterium]
MPRIRGLGELDWAFSYPTVGYWSALESDHTPVVLQGRKVCRLRFTLKLEVSLVEISSGYEMGYYDCESECWTVSGDEFNTKINNKFKRLLQLLAHKHRDVWRLFYLVSGGNNYCYLELNFMDIEPHTEISCFCRYLDSLARKMSKWWKEIKQEENAVYLERVTAEALFVQATGFLPE